MPLLLDLAPARGATTYLCDLSAVVKCNSTPCGCQVLQASGSQLSYEHTYQSSCKHVQDYPFVGVYCFIVNTCEKWVILHMSSSWPLGYIYGRDMWYALVELLYPCCYKEVN